MPRSRFEQVLERLHGVEKDVRGLLASSVEEGDYDAAIKIAAYARGLQQLIGGAAVVAEDSHPKVAPAPVKAPAGYPKFSRDGRKFEMIGWSKKSGVEYSHVAPRAALDALVEKLADACGSTASGTISANDLLPLENPETGENFPDYYARTFLRWLRAIGLVKKNGHRGYALDLDRDYETLIEAAWKKLPARG